MDEFRHHNFWLFGMANRVIQWSLLLYNCLFILTISDNCRHSISQHVRSFLFIIHVLERKCLT